MTLDKTPRLQSEQHTPSVSRLSGVVQPAGAIWQLRDDITGDPITSWNDETASGWDCTNGTPAQRPPVGTMEGFDAPDFEGAVAADFLSTTSPDLAGLLFNLAAWNVWVIWNADAFVSGAPATYYQSPGLVVDTDGWVGLVQTDAGVLIGGFNDGVADHQVSSGAGLDDGNTHVGRFSWDGTTLRVRADNAAEGSVVTGAPPRVLSGTDFLRTGAQYPGTPGMDGRLHVWGYPSMTAGEVTQMYEYLAAEYGVTTP